MTEVIHIKSLPWHLTSEFFVQSMFYSAIQWEIDVSQIAHIAPSIHISSSSTRNSQGNGYVCFCGLLLGGSMSIVAINVRGWYIASVSLQASTLILYFGLKSDNRSKIIWNVILTNTCLKKINHLLSRKKKKNSHWLILKVFQWSKTTRHHKAILRHNVQWFTRLRFHIKGHNTRLITEPTVLVVEEMVNLSINA